MVLGLALEVVAHGLDQAELLPTGPSQKSRAARSGSSRVPAGLRRGRKRWTPRLGANWARTAVMRSVQ